MNPLELLDTECHIAACSCSLPREFVSQMYETPSPVFLKDKLETNAWQPRPSMTDEFINEESSERSVKHSSDQSLEVALLPARGVGQLTVCIAAPCYALGELSIGFGFGGGREQGTSESILLFIAPNERWVLSRKER